MNVYQLITDRIIKSLENGVIPWERPWIRYPAVSYDTQKRYSFLNQMLVDGGGEYLTFRSAREHGGYVKRGEKGSVIMFFKMLDVPKEGKEPCSIEDERDIVHIPMPRYYTVFHISQCCNVESKLSEQYPDIARQDEKAEQLVNDYISRENIRLNRSPSSNSAYYSPMEDSITLPDIMKFKGTEGYYSTLLHEIIHSSGHPNRLNRYVPSSFGSQNYAREELCAEIGSCFLMNELGLKCEECNSTAYIQNWLQQLKNDSKLIVSASAQAEKAVRFILGKEGDDNDLSNAEEH